MIHINEKFKVIDKDKKIIWSIIFALFILNLAALIAVSWYSNDLAVSTFFRKGIKNDFVRWISSFVIADGFNSLFTYLVPLLMVVVESLYIYVKNRKSKVPQTVYKTAYIIIYVICIAVFEFAVIAQIPSFYGFFKPDGFWKKGSTYFASSRILSGWEFYSIYVVSIILNNVIGLGLFGYVHFVLAKRKDFMESQYWLKAIQGFIFLGILYLIYTLVSQSMQRPHPYRVTWNDYLEDIRTIDNGKYAQFYDNYIHQNEFNYGWIVDGWNKNPVNGVYDNQRDLEGSWAWWQSGADRRDHYSYDNDFPSGHINEICASTNALMIIFGGKNQSKKQRTLKMSLFGVMVVWCLAMIFSMLIGQGHWLSDLTFSFVIAVPAYFVAWVITHGVFKALPNAKPFKTFKINEWSNVIALILMFGVTITSASMPTVNPEGLDEIIVGGCQLAFSLIVLLIIWFNLAKLIAEKSYGISFAFTLLEIVTFTFTTISAALFLTKSISGTSEIVIAVCGAILALVSVAYSTTNIVLETKKTLKQTNLEK